MANLGYLQLTRNCLQHCRFCSNPPTGVDLTEPEMRALIDDLVALRYDGIILTGGEPTLSPLLLPSLRYARERGLRARMITNGQALADRDLFARCADAGLEHVHLSLHSWRPEVHDFVSAYPNAWRTLVTALAHVPSLGISADLNCVICSYNADHLHETVMWATDRFPFVRHFVWNALDPEDNRTLANLDVIPRQHEFQVSLELAMEYLHATGRSFRAERVPLCFMRRFAWANTECRKIVKQEQRSIRFLDSKGFVQQLEFLHAKGDACDACRWDGLCAGLHSMARYYDESELSPVFEAPEPVVEAVLHRRPDAALLRRLAARRGGRSAVHQPKTEDREAALGRLL